MVMGIVVEEMMMVFGFGNMLSQQPGEHVDKLLDFVAVDACREDVGEFSVAGKLQKTGKRAAIEFEIKTETDLGR
jgi:hypothetical protein